MEGNKLAVKSFAFAAGVVWGAGVLVVGLVNLKFPGYGQAFLNLASSIYPGYDAVASLKSVLVGTGYGLVDGAIGGALLAWLYNGCVGSGCCKK